MLSFWKIRYYKQLILLKLVDFPMVPRYNSYLGAPWLAFEVIQKGGLMGGMSIFTVRQPNDVISSVPYSGGFKILSSFGDCDIGICDV